MVGLVAAGLAAVAGLVVALATGDDRRDDVVNIPVEPSTTGAAASGGGGQTPGPGDLGGGRAVVRGAGLGQRPFELGLPGGWRDATEDLPERIAGVRPELVLTAATSEDFTTNVVVVATRTDVPLEDVPGAVLETTRTQAPDARLLGAAARRSVAGEDAVAVDYAFTGPGDTPLRGRQVAFYRDDALFQLIFTDLTDRFEARVGDFEAIVGSFRFS